MVFIKAGLQAYEKDKGDPKQTAQDVINEPYDYNFKFDERTYKYLDGKNVNRYFITWSNMYTKYGNHLAAPRTFELFNGKKIIIREITGTFPKSIISSYIEETYLFNRSNIGITEKSNLNISLKYIVKHSKQYFNFILFYKKTLQIGAEAISKIILNDLRKFPIKNIIRIATTIY